MKGRGILPTAVEWVGLIVAFTCCLPCALRWRSTRLVHRKCGYRPNWNPFESYPDYQAIVYSPWSQTRRRRSRALTLPLQGNTRQRTLEQAQSDFISRLPLELRRRVYEYALGGDDTYLRSFRGTLMGIRPRSHHRNTKHLWYPCLSLLLTCRQMHVYSSSVLCAMWR